VIEISHLTKKYGGHLAVDDLSLQIAQGKIYGFLGPNGAGKSTTMNIITGYLAATQGTVTIDGFDIFKQPEEAKKCLGYLPEQPPLYMDMTVYEYLKFVADLKKLPRQKRSQYISEAMELTRISDMKKRLIRNLSKGYRQRVGFAQAVLGYPKVIILDEPTVGLDPKQMIEIRELILSLGRQHTVILSSHILSEIKEVCEHIFIISKGRLAASDTTENLIAQMSGGQEISLLVKGSAEAVTETMGLAGLMPESIVPGAEEGCVRAALKAQKGEDLREQVFYAFAQAGIPILEMRADTKSLEQVFLELTSKEADTAAQRENKALENKTSEDKTSEDEKSEDEKSEDKTSENRILENKTPENETQKNKTPEKIISEGKIPEDKILENKTPEKITSEKITSEKITSEDKASKNINSENAEQENLDGAEAPLQSDGTDLNMQEVE